MKKIKVLKNILLISLLIIFILSCKKKEDESVNINNDSSYISKPENIYHKTYTNVVKIQGKFVKIDSLLSYRGREEGEYYEDYDIFEAIQNHSLKRVQELIKEGEDINQTYTGDNLYSEFMDDSYSAENTTPLSFAVFYRDLGIMKYLLDNGANPFIQDDDSWNAFLWACGTGNIDTIKMLAEFDTDLIYSENIYKANGLHIAALNDNIEVFEYLVNTLGIDINSKDEDGDGVLYYANENGAIEKLKELGAE
ncbi:ankyrin repeat domain-containing protein [uncultured Brachyspira sp.]|uniref:ankyrin repeat domain-containing protein n=1 Tax=uncultured Brachyspira sp. TaxID=221953 RepID=UPI0025ED2747|nr:ankyrin repeat domain-containing protein [uncultured Brachyspira sp.]